MRKLEYLDSAERNLLRAARDGKQLSSIEVLYLCVVIDELREQLREAGDEVERLRYEATAVADALDVLTPEAAAAALRRIVSGPGGLPSSRCAGVL